MPLDLDDIVARTVRLLAQLTRQVAVVQYPSLRGRACATSSSSPLTTSRLLVVLITNTGRVEQRVVETPVEAADALLGELRAQLNAAVVGVRLPDAPGRLADLPERFTADRPAGRDRVMSALLESLVEEHEERVVLGGPPTWRGSAPTSPTASVPCSKRSRSRWCCCDCSARRVTRRY